MTEPKTEPVVLEFTGEIQTAFVGVPMRDLTAADLEQIEKRIPRSWLIDGDKTLTVNEFLIRSGLYSEPPKSANVKKSKPKSTAKKSE